MDSAALAVLEQLQSMELLLKQARRDFLAFGDTGMVSPMVSDRAVRCFAYVLECCREGQKDVRRVGELLDRAARNPELPLTG